MKIIICSNEGSFFCKKPEVGLTENKKNAHVFDCYNKEHATLILQKTKEFISNENLKLEFIDTSEIDLRI
jgi:hypothetical protein